MLVTADKVVAGHHSPQGSWPLQDTKLNANVFRNRKK
jgi:hypothetical protein